MLQKHCNKAEGLHVFASWLSDLKSTVVVYALCIICEARHHNQEAPLCNKMLTSKAPVGPSQDTVGREHRRRLTVSSAEATHILI